MILVVVSGMVPKVPATFYANLKSLSLQIAFVEAERDLIFWNIFSAFAILHQLFGLLFVAERSFNFLNHGWFI